MFTIPKVRRLRSHRSIRMVRIRATSGISSPRRGLLQDLRKTLGVNNSEGTANHVLCQLHYVCPVF
jgi:hypothetical protein